MLPHLFALVLTHVCDLVERALTLIAARCEWLQLLELKIGYRIRVDRKFRIRDFSGRLRTSLQALDVPFKDFVNFFVQFPLLLHESQHFFALILRDCLIENELGKFADCCFIFG